MFIIFYKVKGKSVETMNIFSFSGGKDSTAMILIAKKKGIQIDKIVFYDTLLEFPQMEEHILKFEKYIGIKIERIFPERHFFYLMTEHRVHNNSYGGYRNGYGWPTMLRRWCTAEKKKALYKWKRSLSKDAIFFVGIAANESRPLDPTKRYPLVEYGITEKDSLQICYNHGFDFGGLYQYFDRVSCWCCPLGGKKRAKILYKHFPELWEKIKWIQKFAFHDFGDHQNYLEGKSYVDLENEFNDYGQMKLF